MSFLVLIIIEKMTRYNLNIKSNEKLEIKLGDSEISLSLEKPGTTVGKIEMGEDKIIDRTIIHRRSKLEEYSTSSTVLPKKTRKKKLLKESEIPTGVSEFAKSLLPKPKGKRWRPKGKKRWPRLSSKK